MSDLEANIVEMRKEGYSCRVIAEEYNVSPSKVARICQAAGVTKNNGYTARGKHYAAKPTPPPVPKTKEKRPDLWPDIPKHIRITDRGD